MVVSSHSIQIQATSCIIYQEHPNSIHGPVFTTSQNMVKLLGEVQIGEVVCRQLESTATCMTNGPSGNPRKAIKKT